MQYNWELFKSDGRIFAGFENYHPIINILLESLGMADAREAKSFLDLNETSLHSPINFSEIEEIVSFIVDAAKHKRKIFVHGDFDVDGVVATSILWDFLYRQLGANIHPIIPNRIDEGYGLSEKTLNKIKEQGGEIVITVDCGIKNTDLVSKFPELDFIITDHHTYPTDENGNKIKFSIPNLVGILHPQHPNSNYPFNEICGAMVSWKLICAIVSRLQLDFDPDEYLPFVGLATVTDVMPLVNENRYVVKKALGKINTKKPLAFESIMKAASTPLNKTIGVYHLGFVFGPHLNAAGRISDAIEAVRLLCTRSEEKATELSKNLHSLNVTRQELTQEFLNLADQQIEDQKDSKLYFIYGEDWPEGILGLVAGKMQEKYQRPIIAASLSSKSNIVKGSARSFSQYHITHALGEMKKYLSKFGGHAQAAGFSLEPIHLEIFKESIVDHANSKIDNDMLIPKLKILSKLTIENINDELLNTIELFEPFGFGNPKPKFLFENLEIIEIKKLGKGGEHLHLYLGNKNNRIKAIGFHLVESFKDLCAGAKIDLVASPQINEWNGGRSVQLEIKDIQRKDG